MMTATVPTVAAVEEALRAAWLGHFREPTATGYVLATEGATVVLTVEPPTFVPFQTGRYDGFKDPQEGQAEWLLGEAADELGRLWAVTRRGDTLHIGDDLTADAAAEERGAHQQEIEGTR